MIIMKNKTSQYTFFILVSSLAVWLDIFTKALASKYLMSGYVYKLIPNIIEFTYVKNRGASFGILQNQMIFFYVITAAVMGMISYTIYKLPSEQKYFPFYLCILFIFSGASGNLIDRVVNGYVVDFIYFKPINFPVFNMADIYITVSVFFLFILAVFIYKEDDMAFILSKKGSDANTKSVSERIEPFYEPDRNKKSKK